MTNSARTRVFLVDDHPIVRDGFRDLLEVGGRFTIAGEAGSGEETLAKAPEADADLAVVDISMDGMDGIELTRRLKEMDGNMKILIVSMHGETRYVEEALDAGATGYVLKDNVHAVLPEAAREVMNDGFYLDEDLKDKIDLP